MIEKWADNPYTKIEMRIVSLYELLRWEEKGILNINSPNNRKLRWIPEQKSQLIESILVGIPIQAIFLLKSENGKYEIIDGLQRVKTIIEFVKDKFELESKNARWNHYRFSQMDVIDQRRIEDFQLVVYIVRDEDGKSVADTIFKCLNLNQQRYSSQEIRNYRYRNSGIPFIRRLAEDECFLRVLSEKEVLFNALQHHELALRFMSFSYKGWNAYNGNMKSFLDDTLENYEKYRDRELEFEQKFKEVFYMIDRIWGEAAFLTNRKARRANLALYDVITYSFACYNKVQLEINRDKILKLPDQLLDGNHYFRDAVVGVSNNSKAKVNTRFTIWLDEMGKIMGEKNVKPIFSEKF